MEMTYWQIQSCIMSKGGLIVKEASFLGYLNSFRFLSFLSLRQIIHSYVMAKTASSFGDAGIWWHIRLVWFHHGY